LGADLTDSKRR